MILNDQSELDLFLNFGFPAVGTKLKHNEILSLVLQAGLKGAGNVGCNPLVGAIALDRYGCFLGYGGHLKWGESHAEVNLVQNLIDQNLMERLHEGTIICSLEPCSITGKTPPCSELIKKLPIKNLIYGHIDPNPNVCGSGIKAITEKGIICEQDFQLQNVCQNLIASFITNQQLNRSHVSLKIASALGGGVGYSTEGRVQVTGPKARQFGYYLRRKHEAILIGCQTVLHDNPSLTIRELYKERPEEEAKSIIVLDPHLKAILASKDHLLNIFKNKNTKFFWVIKKDCAHEFEGIKKEYTKQHPWLNNYLIKLECEERNNGAIDLEYLLQRLYLIYRIPSVLVEGGPITWNQFINQKCVDQVYFFQSTQDILGGAHCLSFQQPIGHDVRMTLQNKNLTALDQDILISGFPTYSEPNERLI